MAHVALLMFPLSTADLENFRDMTQSPDIVKPLNQHQQLPSAFLLHNKAIIVKDSF